MATTSSKEVRELRIAVNSMDCAAHQAFSEIAAIAKLALHSLKTPDGGVSKRDMMHALRAIWNRADGASLDLSGMAFDVGCEYVDESISRMVRSGTEAVERGREAEMKEAAAARAGKESAPA